MSGISVPTLCLVTDRRQLTPDARTEADRVLRLESWLEEAIDLVDLIQIRERDLEAGLLLGLVERVAQRTRDTRTRVLVNDRADVALAAGADGVHLRADGPDPARIRALGPAGWLLGRSVHGLDEVRAGGAADYLLFGTMFPTASKPPDVPTQGVAALSEAIRSTDRPILAIGGMTPSHAVSCFDAGAAGVAAIGLFLPASRGRGSLGILRAVEELRAAFGLLRPRSRC